MPFPQPPFNSPVQTEPTIKGIVTIKAVWQNWLQLVQMFLANLTDSGPTSARPTTDLWVGRPFFDTTINVPVYWDGSTWVTSSPTGTVTAVTGTSPIASSGGTTPNISITEANATTDGYLSAADWNTFNNKQPSGTYVNSVGGTAPVVSSGGTSPVISMAAANGTTNGYLTSTDWNTFNNAASYGTYINVQKYGAYPDDNPATTTAAIQAAINANPYRTLYFPAGRYYVTSLNSFNNKALSFIGDNQNSSAIFATTSTGNVLNIDTKDACLFQNITFTTDPSVTRTSGAYISITAPTGNENTYSCFTNCGFISGWDGIHFVKAAHWRITSCQFQQQSGVATIVENQNNLDSGDSSIVSSLYSMASSGYGIIQYTAGGLKILGSKFLSGVYQYAGVFTTGPGTSSSTSILVITGNSFEGAHTTSIALNTISNSFSQVNISGNQISVDSGKLGIETVGTALSFVYIGGNETFLYGSGQFLSIGGGSGITIGSNAINGTSSANGLAFYNSAEVYVCPQSFNAAFVNRFLAYTVNTKFEMGQAQNGQSSAFMSSSGYGGGLYRIDTDPVTGGVFRRVAFNYEFASVPNVVLNLYAGQNENLNTGGAVGVILGAVTTTYFEWFAFGLNSTGQIYIVWEAYLTGQ